MSRYATGVLAVLLVLAVTATFAWAGRRVIKGKAVYYADRYAGQTMACGGKYQPWKMIAASRHLPCGTRLKVKNRRNGRIVHVTVKDRGPYGDPGTVLDLSKKAAHKLGYLHRGHTRVRAVVLDH